MAMTEKRVVVIAGPSGSGKNSLIREIERRYHNCDRLVTATTRQARFGPALNTYYGIYAPDLDRRIKAGKLVFAQVDIIGARVLKEKYNATTIFIMPESLSQFEGRLRVRNPEWSPIELATRMKITEDEVHLHAPQYDYRVINADGALMETVEQVIDIMRKEGYNLA